MLTAEKLLELPETKKRLENYGDDYLINKKIKFDLAKTKNYKNNLYFHATGGCSEDGVGKGLYIGKDMRALNNFYNSNGGGIDIYCGNFKYIDLTQYDDFDKFEKEAKQVFPGCNSNEHLKLLALSKGYDGIRYYDPIATGEEYVVYNSEKLTLIKKAKKKKYITL